VVESGAGNPDEMNQDPFRCGEIWIIEKIVVSTGLLNVNVIVEAMDTSVVPLTGLMPVTRKYGSGSNVRLIGG
jgi:hypothetical protein